MRNLIYVLLFVTIGVSAQSFEGVVTYKNLFKSKSPSMTDQQLTQALGGMQQYLIKGGNYKIKSNGTLLRWQLYRENSKILYTKMSNSQALTETDATKLKDSVVSIELNKEAYNYLGTPCDELVIVSKKGAQKFYFNSSILKIDAENFKNFKFRNWYTYLTYANALPVRILIENDDFIMESFICKVEEQKLSLSEFELPKSFALFIPFEYLR